MTSTSINATFTDSAEALGRLNQSADPARPPAVAVASPIHEILVREVAERLPPELRQRLEAEPSVDRVMDWVAVGALLRWIQDQPIERRAFLASVASHPAEAGLALARAMGARMEPPERDAAWHAADRSGLICQVTFILTVLALRSILFATLAWLLGVPPLGTREMEILTMLGLGFVLLAPLDGWLGLATWGIAGLWLIWETFRVPSIMERVRQAPARSRQLAPPLSWRLDTLKVIWPGQALVLAAALLWRIL